MIKSFKFDTPLAATVLFLISFGLIMITSIGVPKSIALSAPGILYPNCSDANVDCYLLFKNHLIRLGVALFFGFIAYKIQIKFYRKISTLAYIATVALLFVVIMFGSSYGTIAQNWLVVLNTSLQPSEFARIGLVLYLANWLYKKKDKLSDFKDGLVQFWIIVGIVLLPIVLQNDFGSVLVLGIIAMAMFLVAGGSYKNILITVLVAMFALIIVVASASHVQERLAGFTKIDEECLEDYCWQSQQANIAVATGGFFGKGLTQGVQKSYWLPQASDDFIFAASAEELGFIRIIFVVLAYLIIAIRGYGIASKSENMFEKLLAVGLTTWITMQAFINIAVNTALFPVTGITLPFVSYGGSSLLSCTIAIAILLNISKTNGSYEVGLNRWRDRRTHNTKYRPYRRS